MHFSQILEHTILVLSPAPPLGPKCGGGFLVIQNSAKASFLRKAIPTVVLSLYSACSVSKFLATSNASPVS